MGLVTDRLRDAELRHEQAVAARDAELVRKRRSGMSNYALAREFAISEPRVRQILRQHGIPARPRTGDAT